MFQTFGGDVTQSSFPSGIELSLNQNITLAWAAQFQNTNNIVYNYMDVIPTAGGFTLTLPNATLSSTFQSVIINNPSAFSFALNANDGSVLIANFAAGTSRYIILIDNTTQQGIWRIFPFAGGGSTVTSINMTSSSPDVVIGGVPITSAGTITLGLAQDLLALTSFGGLTGIACHTAANTWHLRDIIGTIGQIGVTNEDGVGGDITIALASDIFNINSIKVGDIDIAGDTISTLSANANLILAPNNAYVEVQGLGLKLDAGHPIFFYADDTVHFTSLEGGAQTVSYSLVMPTVLPVPGQVIQVGALGGSGYQLQYANVTTFGGPSVVNSIATFSTTFGSIQDSLVFIDNLGNMSGLGGIGITSILVGNLKIADVGGTLPNTIVSTNVDGSIILAPNGAGIIYSNSPFSILNQNPLRLYDAGNLYTSLRSPNPLPQVIDYTLPNTVPLLNQTWVTSGTGTPATFRNVYLPSNENILINGGFTVWQRGTSFTNATVKYPNNNLQYTADMWKIISNGNDIASYTRANGPTGLLTASSPYSLQMTVTGGGAKFGVCQILSYSSSATLIGSQIIMSVTAQGVGTTLLKYAAIYWTGAADAPTTNPISAWGATGTAPTLVANWNYVGNTQYVVNLTGNFVTYTAAGNTVITVPAGTNNLAMMIWCDSTTGVAGNTINITCASLTTAPYFTPYYPDIFSLELLRSKRYFQKDVKYSIAPFTTLTSSARGLLIVSPINAALNIPNNAIYASISYEIEMFGGAAPTIVIYPYTTVTATGVVSDNTGADQAANTGTVLAQYSDSKGFDLQNTSGGNLHTTGYLVFHYTADNSF